jgi:hypothetical protein
MSAVTVGRHPYWQDSGLYLTTIHELGVLYPPGFALYEVLCFLWTKLLFFADFTLAVHLFSSLCAAAAVGIVSMAARDFLRSRGKLLGAAAEDPEAPVEGAAILAGVLLAGSFTFWGAAIYAKGYSFYYLMLALLLWCLVRADGGGRPRDFSLVALMIGLSWQAHPSAALVGPALLYFVVAHAKTLGWKGIAGRTGIAALAAIGPSLVLLPMLMARDPWLSFGRPHGVVEFLRYVAGLRFVGDHGTFGIDGTRVASFFRFAWEDMLGLGLLLALLGASWIGRRNPRVLLWMASWILPYSLVAILFKAEGQHDCWFVAARLPLALVAAAGALRLVALAGRQAPAALAAVGLAATGWAAGVNARDLTQRDYLLAEHYGRMQLERVDPDAIVIVTGDDGNGLGSYMHRVRGERPDVILISSSFLGSEGSWYEDSLLARYPSLRRPDYAQLWERFPSIERKQKATAAFINANAGGTRPIFCALGILPELLRPDLSMIPAGVHWKVVPRNAVPPVDGRYWTFPVEPEQLRPLYRRARGQQVSTSSAGITVRPESYERRLAAVILSARFRLAIAQLEAGQFAGAARLCQSIINYDDEDFEKNPEVVHLLGISYFAAGRMDLAELPLRRSVQISVRKENRATALMYLAEIAAKRGAGEEAQRYIDQAFSIPGLDPAVLRKMEERRKSR